MASRTERVVAIHQPNFLPWLGYFDKLARSDVFILLDDVQFPKKGGTWINRVQVLVVGQPAWITVPVVRSYHGVRTISEMQIDETSEWRPKLLRTVEQNYRRAPFFEEAMPLFREVVEHRATDLAGYNEFGVRRIAIAIGLDPAKLVRSSTLAVTESSTARLVALTGATSGTVYLSGGGADGYQDDSAFAEAGIELRRQGFDHPAYRQLSQPWHPGLSILDALMHCGLAGAGALVNAL